MLSYFKRYLLLAVPCVALTSGIVLGQEGFYTPKKKTSFTIGFKTGKELLFSSLSIKGPNKIQTATRNTFILRKPVSKHFKVETGLSYSTMPNNGTTIKGLDKNSIIKPNKTATSIPMTLQYYFVPAKTRVQVYCGAGVQCNINSAANPHPNFNSHINPDYRAVNGTKYINVLITQGIIFQINTRIQLNQSFHFIPGADTAIGFDLGIGYDIR